MLTTAVRWTQQVSTLYSYFVHIYFVKEGTKAKGREPVKNGNKLIENIGVMDNNNVYDQMLEKNGNVYDMENNGNNGNEYNSYMIGRIGGLLGKWRPTNMQLPTIPMARNGNGNTDNGANVDKDGNNCTNGNDNGGIGNNGNYCNDGRVSGRAGKAKQSLSVAGLCLHCVNFVCHFHLLFCPLYFV